MNSIRYYRWFQKVVSALIEVFFLLASIATLYVFTSFLSGYLRLFAFLILVAVYLFVIYRFKDKIKDIIEMILSSLRSVDEKKMLLILILLMIILKVIYSLLFYFDATLDGDISIYNDIANTIVETGEIRSSAISHLFGVAIHLAAFKAAGMPLHIGIFLVFAVGTIINFFSFKDIVGKEKAFLIELIYLAMPSSMLLTFCPTHELFVYLYLSSFICLINQLCKTRSFGKTCIFAFLMGISMFLTCFVNPVGYITYIISGLVILLSNLNLNKKATIVIAIIFALMCSSSVDKAIDVNEYNTTINTYTILIHGSNPESLGEQVDGYPLHRMRDYILENTNDFSHEGFIEASKHVLMDQYLFLLKNPVVLMKLIGHKIYILWSGVHYPIELAHYYHSINDLTFYLLLAISTLIYLFMLTIGTVYRRFEPDEISISNYKLVLLGVIAVTMLSVVLNKYFVYVTLFIYLISFKKSSVGENL